MSISIPFIGKKKDIIFTYELNLDLQTSSTLFQCFVDHFNPTEHIGPIDIQTVFQEFITDNQAVETLDYIPLLVQSPSNVPDLVTCKEYTYLVELANYLGCIQFPYIQVCRYAYLLASDEDKNKSWFTLWQQRLVPKDPDWLAIVNENPWYQNDVCSIHPKTIYDCHKFRKTCFLCPSIAKSRLNNMVENGITPVELLHHQEHLSLYESIQLNPFDYLSTFSQNDIIELSSHVQLGIKTDQPTMIFCQSVEQFKTSLYLEYPFLQHIIGENVLLGGGLCLRHVSNSSIPTKDADIMIYGEDEQQVRLDALDVAKKLFLLSSNVKWISYGATIKFLIDDTIYIDLVLVKASNSLEVISRFDLDIIRCAFDGENVFVTPSCARSWLTRTVQSFSLQQTQPFKRIQRSLDKGFHVSKYIVATFHVTNLFMLSSHSALKFFQKNQEINDTHVPVLRPSQWYSGTEETEETTWQTKSYDHLMNELLAPFELFSLFLKTCSSFHQFEYYYTSFDHIHDTYRVVSNSDHLRCTSISFNVCSEALDFRNNSIYVGCVENLQKLCGSIARIEFRSHYGETCFGFIGHERVERLRFYDVQYFLKQFPSSILHCCLLEQGEQRILSLEYVSLKLYS